MASSAGGISGEVNRKRNGFDVVKQRGKTHWPVTKICPNLTAIGDWGVMGRVVSLRAERAAHAVVFYACPIHGGRPTGRDADA